MMNAGGTRQLSVVRCFKSLGQEQAAPIIEDTV